MQQEVPPLNPQPIVGLGFRFWGLRLRESRVNLRDFGLGSRIIPNS